MSAESRMGRGQPLTVVTGGTRGIGAAVARRLAGEGHDLVLGYRSDTTASQSLISELAAGGRRCVAVVADLTSEAGVDVLFEAAASLGLVTGLVNNAGVTAHIGDLADTPVPVIRSVIELNLVSVVLCCRRAAQVMALSRGGNGGAIVNLSSAAASIGSAHEYVHYAAAKAGVETLTVGLARELASEGVRVNAVAPGIVRTRIHEDAGDAERVDRAASRIPLGRAAEADEVAPAITFLLSPEASYVTGAVLRVAGGL